MKAILAKKSDVKGSAEILVEAYFKSLKDAKEHITNHIKKKECIIVIQNKEVLGVLIYSKDYSHYANYIDDIAVAKKHRRKGVARLLLKKFIDVSKKEQPKKQRYALSSTDVTNKSSIKMHLNFGFKKAGILKRLHYGKDEIFFAYRLK